MNEQLREATARLWLALDEQTDARWPDDPAQLPEFRKWWAANLAKVEAAQREVVIAALDEYTALKKEAQP